MAETVKKSRIVSDTTEDNLEEALMEEFNLRLKSCMSQDDLQNPDDEEEDENEAENKNNYLHSHHYDNVEIIKSTTTTTNGDNSTNSRTTTSSQDFIRNEQENYYDEPRWLITVTPKNAKNSSVEERSEEVGVADLTSQQHDKRQSNGCHDDTAAVINNHQDHNSHLDTSREEAIYENVSTITSPTKSNHFAPPQTKDEHQEKTDDGGDDLDPSIVKRPTTLPGQYVDMTIKSPPPPENYEIMAPHQIGEDEDDDKQKPVVPPPLSLSVNVINSSSSIDLCDNSTSSLSPKDGEVDVFGANKSSSVKDRMLLSTDATPCLLFSQTVTSPMLTPSEENIDFLKGFRRESSTQNSTESSPASSSEVQPPVTDLDDQQSEIITVEKETSSSSSPSPPIRADKEENIYENAEFLKNNSQSPQLIQDEVIYENIKSAVPDVVVAASAAIGDNIYENLRDLNDRGDAIYQNIEELKLEASQPSNVTNEQEQSSKTEEDQKSEDLISEELASDGGDATAAILDAPASAILDVPSSILENGSGGSCAPDSVVVDRDLEAVPPKIVENLKSQFIAVAQAPSVNSTSDKKEIEDARDLKFVDITKQISKFERNEDTSTDDENDSTQVTESYVETTTTIESNSSSDKGLKKKKTKKSRKEEKENISVNGNCTSPTNTNGQEFSYYNVNVRNLCRSFGDLTKVQDNNNDNKAPSVVVRGRRGKNCTENRARAKSLSDVVTPSPATTTTTALPLLPNKFIENVFSGVSVRALREKFHCVVASFGDGSLTTARSKSSFNKFDALQKKNVLHVRSSDSSKAQEKFNGAQVVDTTSSCKACEKVVFQMEQIKAEKAIWHKNCFRCRECNKQLTVDTYQSHEGTLYCKPHFKALFAPKVVDDEPSPRSRKPEPIIRENQPAELPPDVVRASDKPDLGLEELQSINMKERFHVFEHHQQTMETGSDLEKTAINVKRSPSILSKLARFQAKGMDIGVTDDALNGIPIEESSSEEEEQEAENDELDGEDADLVRAKRVQKEKPFHFTGMSDVKSKWEQGEQHSSRDERREERKQEIQTIRNRLFMGKQIKMKEAYQQAVMESESCTNLKKEQAIESCDTKSLKERFEKGELIKETVDGGEKDKDEEAEVFESEISKKSRSLFLELDAHASKAPQITPLPTPKLDVKKAREAYVTKMTISDDVVKSSAEQIDEVQVSTADLQERFKFFETYKEPEKEKKKFRITPPREGQVKAPTPDREVYRDPDVVRSEEIVEDSVIAKQSHTATKMLNKFRQMEEELGKEAAPQGLKPLKRFTPPPEPTRPESNSEAESGSEEETDEDEEDETDRAKVPDDDLLEAQKAARAKQLRAKFERWEANEIKKEQNNSAVNIAEEFGEEQSQIESTRTLRARFESMRQTTTADSNRTPRVKVNRFVEFPSITETCESCNSTVYPLEKISVHGRIYHKRCFKCMECNCVLRMDSYSYNQGLLYCMPHFKRLFISKGNYDTGFGLGQHKGKWTAAPTTTATNGNAQVA